MAMEEGDLQNMEGKTFQEFLEGYIPHDTTENPFAINESIPVPSNEEMEARKRQVQVIFDKIFVFQQKKKIPEAA